VANEIRPIGPEDEAGEVVPVGRETYELDAARGRAVAEAQYAIARAHPRSIKRFWDEARTLATLTPEIAKACIYQIPRDGKVIRGKSVRLAEIAAYCFGNLLVQTRIKAVADRYVVAEATCIDLERNVGASTEVRRRIVDSKGRTYSDDMINTTAMAAQSIAYRNAVLDVIPGPLVEPIYRAALGVAAGEGKPVEERRGAWREWLKKRGVKDHEAFRTLGVRGWEEVGLEQFETLAAYQAAIKDGGATIDDVFRAPDPGLAPADRLAVEIDRGRGPGEDDEE
jgi:hypothetical protein